MSGPGRFLWVGDAVSKTGFAKVTHNLVPRLLAAGWEGAVLGINYYGDPHRFPYPIFPAELGGDPWGLGRIQDLVTLLKPDVVIVNNDPWNVREFVAVLKGAVPVIGYMPVDSPNVPSCRDLTDLKLAMWYTQFGREEAAASGYYGPSVVVPHGVDAALYGPRDRAACLEQLGIVNEVPANAFIVGNVNRNSPRKRLDLTVIYFAAWWERMGKPPHAYLYLHTSNIDSGPNLLQLAIRVGLSKRVILTHATMKPGEGVAEEMMPFVYSLFDVQLTTTQGEGWGLTTHEGMACGVPQIVPEHAALGEWPAGAVQYVPATLPTVNGNGVNSIGMAPEAGDVVDALTLLYEHPDLRLDLAGRGQARARDPRFTWDAVGALFHAHVRAALQGPKIEAVSPAVIAGGSRGRAVSEQTASPAGDEGAREAAGGPRPTRTKTGPVEVRTT